MSTWPRRVGLSLTTLLALSVAADVFLGVFSVPAAAAEHVLVQLVLWPFVLADSTMMLPHRTPDVLVQGVGVGVFGWFLARWADEGRRWVGVALEVLIAAPLLLVLLAVIGAGFALAPPVALGCAIAGAFGGIAIRTGHEDTLTPLPSGLPRGAARWTLLIGGGLALTMTGTVMASGPGDSQVPFTLLAALEGALAPTAWPWLVCLPAVVAIVLAWPEGTARTRAGSPTGRVVAAAGMGSLVTGVFVAWTAPSGEVARLTLAVLPMPLVTATMGAAVTVSGRPWWPGWEGRPWTWIVRLALPVSAALLGLLHVATTGFLGCEDVRSHPAMSLLSADPGAFAVQPTSGGEAVVVAFRDDERLSWIPATGEGVVVHDLNDLELDGWEGHPPPLHAAYPEELGLAADGRVHAWVEVPPPGDARVRLLLEDGQIVDQQELPDACFVSSWLWDEPRDRAVSGCEWQGDLMIEDSDGLRRATVEGAGELEEIVADPSGVGWFAVSLWSHPYLEKIDPVSLRSVGRRFVGSFNWGLGADFASGLLALPRFVAGQVLFLDASTMEVVSSVRAGWGLRPIVKTRGPWVTASTYGGRLYAVDPQEGLVGSLRVGGWVRDLDLLDEDTLVLGGMCGVMTVDLNAWLD